MWNYLKYLNTNRYIAQFTTIKIYWEEKILSAREWVNQKTRLNTDEMKNKTRREATRNWCESVRENERGFIFHFNCERWKCIIIRCHSVCKAGAGVQTWKQKRENCKQTWQWQHGDSQSQHMIHTTNVWCCMCS